MDRRVLIVGGLLAIGVLAWWRGRSLDELTVEAEDVTGLGPTAGDLAAIAGEPNVMAFLRVIRTGEGTDGPKGYRMLFGGDTFASFADHPRIAVTRGSLTSTAAGAYQILARTWDDLQGSLALPDFSPPYQDIAALFLIRRRGALADVQAGNFDSAIAKVAKEWASMPGSPYGQPTISLARAEDVYTSSGGSIA